MAKVFTTDIFETEVLNAEKPVLVDFWATWCGPCRRQAPVVEELAEAGYEVGKVDVDKEPSLAQQYKIMSIPTLLVFKGGKEYVYKKDPNHKGMPSPIITFKDVYHFMEWKAIPRAHCIPITSSS